MIFAWRCEPDYFPEFFSIFGAAGWLLVSAGAPMTGCMNSREGPSIQVRQTCPVAVSILKMNRSTESSWNRPGAEGSVEVAAMLNMATAPRTMPASRLAMLDLIFMMVFLWAMVGVYPPRKGWNSLELV